MGLEHVLEKLKAGEYDGNLSERESNGTATIWQILNGIAERVYHGRSTDFFDGKEHTRTARTPEITKYETDDELKEFIQRYGYKDDLFGYDEEAKEVSRQYYNERDKR